MAVFSWVSSTSGKPRLAAMVTLFQAHTTWTAESLEAAFKAWAEAQGWQLKDVAQPLRVAVTGRSASPPIFDVLVVLGRERSLARLERAAGASA